MNPAFLTGTVWLAATITMLVASYITGEKTTWLFWFFMGASLFFFGVSHIIEEIKKVRDA